mmetsp:Transcript_28113/g.43100  ORF Transcript_28113/g.43100 Transcript_28113/m.43100 type:complete len:433 (-) Transcript_28113:99-1397(-)
MALDASAVPQAATNATKISSTSPQRQSLPKQSQGRVPWQSYRRSSNKEKLSFIKTILGECLCEPPVSFTEGLGGFGRPTQFIELHGIEFIGLGAVSDELSPPQRITETLEQLILRPERLISVGVLVDKDQQQQQQISESAQQPLIVQNQHQQQHHHQQKASKTMDEDGILTEERQILCDKVSETVPLEVYKQNYPNDASMSKVHQKILDYITVKKFDSAIEEFNRELNVQMARPNRGNNKYLAGITAHNIAVMHVLSGNCDQALDMYRQAAQLKESAFGKDHPRVALSLNEIGIQLFAKGEFEEALALFFHAKRIHEHELGVQHYKVSPGINNIACCNFQMKNYKNAMIMFQEAFDLQHNAAKGSSTELDLLHVAIALSNLGYMKLRIKEYEEASGLFEEALLVQQSVFGDDHNKAIQDTLSNIDFANAFHS